MPVGILVLQVVFTLDVSRFVEHFIRHFLFLRDMAVGRQIHPIWLYRLRQSDFPVPENPSDFEPTISETTAVWPGIHLAM
jgi:hypothetical protein